MHEQREVQGTDGHPKIVDRSVLVRRLVNKQVFLGMAALKLSTSQELSARVASFHEVRNEKR